MPVWCGAPSGSQAVCPLLASSSAGARYTGAPRYNQGLGRSVEEGGILLVSGTPGLSEQGSLLHPVLLLHTPSVSHPAASQPLLFCPVMLLESLSLHVCYLYSEVTAVYFVLSCSWHGESIDAGKESCINWGLDYPGPGISVGDRPGRMAKCMWGPSSFNSRPGWLCLGHSFSALGRQTRGIQGLQFSGTDRKMEGAPPCSYGTSTPSTNGRADLDHQAHRARKPNHKIHALMLMLMLTLR